MTHFCTSIQRHADFEICQKLPLKELIFEHQSLSRFGELETATLLEMLEAWKTSGGKAFLQWDLLHDEKSFEEALEVQQIGSGKIIAISNCIGSLKAAITISKDFSVGRIF